MAGQVARDHGWTARFGDVDRTKPKSTERFIDQALDEGCTRLALVGGDGTFHRVVNILHEQKHLKNLELAMIPAGTCNDFARSLNLSPHRVADALTLACRGKASEADLGVFRVGTAKTERIFLNNAGFGRRPVQKAAPRSTARKTLKQFQPTPLRIRWDKGSIEGQFYFGVFCNAPYFSKGLCFSRNPRLDDGLLDAYLVPVMPRWKLAAALVRGRLGGTIMARGVLALKLSQFTIESDVDIWPQADGEPLPAKAVRQASFGIAAQKAMIVFSQ